MLSKLDNKKLKRFFLVAISIIYGLVIAYVVGSNDVVSILALTAAIALGIQLSTLEDIHDIDRKISAKEPQNKGDVFLRRHKTGNMSVLFDKIRDDLHQTLIADEDSFIINNNHLALPYYVEYWETLVKCQALRNPQEPLTVKITHSCALDIWENHPLTNSLLELQDQFGKKGGKIERILCYAELTGTQENQLFNVSRRMTQVTGMEVRTYDIKSNLVPSHQFAWDFLIVPEIHEAVIWDSFSYGQPIRKSIHKTGPSYERYENKSLSHLFNSIKQHSKKII